MAADRRATVGGTIFSVTKIFRDGPDRLVGVNGSLARVGAFRAWLADGAKPEDYPPNPTDDDLYMLVVHRGGRIWRYANTPWPVTVEEPFSALGTGMDFALAAMACGRNAVEAVEITSRFDQACGNGIDVLTFEDPAP